MAKSSPIAGTKRVLSVLVKRRWVAGMLTGVDGDLPPEGDRGDTVTVVRGVVATWRSLVHSPLDDGANDHGDHTENEADRHSGLGSSQIGTSPNSIALLTIGRRGKPILAMSG
jgi:hypothetical protein